MYWMRPLKSLTILALVGAVTGCNTYEPVKYTGLESSGVMRADSENVSGRVPYSYNSHVNWQRYNSILFDRVSIYRGADQQFGDLSDADKAELAAYMQEQFEEKARASFQIASKRAPGTLRVRLTLTGAKANTPVLGTLSRVDIAGGIYNGVQTVRGKEGSMTGSIIYAVEIFDAATNKLLKAYVSKQYPSPMNIAASVRPLDASKNGIEKGAEEFAANLRS